MERSTKEIILKDSNAKVVLYEYLSHGQIREIRRRIADHLKISMDDKNEVKINDLSGSISMDEEDFAVRMFVREIVDSEGKAVTDIEKFVFDLSEDDGNLLYNSVNDLYKKSTLSKEDKKK